MEHTRYRIVIEGTVDPRLLEAPGTFTVSTDGEHTVLTGPASNDELKAVLDRLLVHDLTLLALQAHPG